MANAKLRATLFAIAGCLLASSPAWADWTEYGGDAEHHLVTSEKITAPLAVAWKHTTNVYADKVGNMGGPVISGGLVFFPSKNRIIAVDSASGEVKWRVPEGDVNDPKIPHITSTPAVNGDMVFVPDSSNTMTAYSVADGTEAWRFRTQGSVRSAPTIVGDYLYFGSDDGYVYCVACKDGSLRWKSNDRGKSFQLSDAVAASPTYYNGVIYVNSSDLKMWALQADTGRVMWLQRLGAPSVDISPVAFNGKIFLAAGSTIYQFHLRGGQYHAYALQQWVNNDITSTPIITEKAWYFGDRDGYFHAFNNLGKPLLNDQGKEWKLKLEGKAQGTPILTSDTLYVSTDKGFIYGIDPKKGEITWNYRTEAPKGISPLYSYYAIRAPMAVSDGQLYVVGDDGTLTCLRSDAPDDDGPMITTPRPSRGAVMNGSPPIYISAYMWDEGSGVNPDTIELLIDGKPVERSAKPYSEKQIGDMDGWVYDPLKRMVHYMTPKGEKDKPEPTLINGRHKIQIQALDWHGNASSLEWSFVVDNSLPRNAIATTPKAGGSRNSNNPYGSTSGSGGPNGPGGQNGQNNNRFRGRGGGYQYQNRGQGGYGFGNRGQQGGFGGSGGGGYGGSGGGGRGGFGF